MTEFNSMTQLVDEISQDKKTSCHSICFNFISNIKSKVKNTQSFNLPVDFYFNILIQIELHSILNRFHKIYCKIFFYILDQKSDARESDKYQSSANMATGIGII